MKSSYRELLLGDLVDQAGALVEELLLAVVPLHALEHELHPARGGMVMRARR
jgi:hypothetical protein